MRVRVRVRVAGRTHLSLHAAEVAFLLHVSGAHAAVVVDGHR